MNPHTPQTEFHEQEPAQQAVVAQHNGKGQFPEYTATLHTAVDTYTIANGDSVNGLEDQARFWLGLTTAGTKVQDGQVRSVTLQQQNPNTGALVKTQTLNAEGRQDALTELHNLGAR